MTNAQKHVVQEIWLKSELKKSPLIMGVLNVLGLARSRKAATYKNAQVMQRWLNFEHSEFFKIFFLDSSKFSLISYITVSFYDIVDCEWNDWSHDPCTKTCGEGTKTKTRTEKVLADHGGKSCDGPRSVEEICNIKECPGDMTRILSSWNWLASC